MKEIVKLFLDKALLEADSDLTAYLQRLSKGAMTEALHILADALAQ